MNPPDAETPEPAVQPIPQAPEPRGGDGLMSRASQQFDAGNKGYLDDEERIIRGYDTNNDGTLQLDEVKKIVRDLRSADKGKAKFRNVAIGTAGVLVFVLLANFGLIWAVLVLTRQVETRSGTLVDPSTGEMVMSKSQGNGMHADLNPVWEQIMANAEAADEDGRRNLRALGIGEPWVHPLHRLNGDSLHVRRLQATWLANINETRDALNQEWIEYDNGANTQATITSSEGTWSVAINSGVWQPVNTTDCDGEEDTDDDAKSWRNIMAWGSTCPIYKAVCCCNTCCQLFLTSPCPTSNN